MIVLFWSLISLLLTKTDKFDPRVLLVLFVQLLKLTVLFWMILQA